MNDYLWRLPSPPKKGCQVRKLIPFLLMLLLSCMAAADTVTMKLVSVGPGSVGGPNSGGGVYVYPYYFSINGSLTTIPLLCDSYDNEVTIGESWQATVTPLSSNNGMLTPLASSGLTKLQAYEEAAYLFGKLAGTPTQADAVAINFAIWGLFSQNALNSSAYGSSGAATQRTLADAALPLSSSFLNNFVIYTPINNTQSSGGLPQEYLGFSSDLPHSPPPPVPEPASLILLGSGLLSASAMTKYRIKK